MTYDPADKYTRLFKSSSAVKTFLENYHTDDLLSNFGGANIVDDVELKRLLIMAYRAGWDKSDKLVWE